MTGPGTSTHLGCWVSGVRHRNIEGKGGGLGGLASPDLHSENMFEAPGNQGGSLAVVMVAGWIECDVVVQDKDR